MLHVERFGKGPDLVVLHGWAMHGGILTGLAQLLSDRFRLHIVDLPGHGFSAPCNGSNLGDWAGAVLEVAPARAWWIGWSLGGLVAQAAASRDSSRFDGLLLLASTPRFVAADNWPNAVEASVFEQFAQQLQSDTDRTLLRFLSLQVRGADEGSETLRLLRQELGSRPRPSVDVLLSGLEILQGSDLRGALAALPMRLRWLLGERDTLVPAAVRTEYPEIDSVVIGGAGHAPFLSHPRHCAEQIAHWVNSDGQKDRHVAG